MSDIDVDKLDEHGKSIFMYNLFLVAAHPDNKTFQSNVNKLHPLRNKSEASKQRNIKNVKLMLADKAKWEKIIMQKFHPLGRLAAAAAKHKPCIHIRVRVDDETDDITFMKDVSTLSSAAKAALSAAALKALSEMIIAFKLKNVSIHFPEGSDSIRVRFDSSAVDQVNRLTLEDWVEVINEKSIHQVLKQGVVSKGVAYNFYSAKLYLY